MVSHNPLPNVTKADTIFEDILDNAVDINGQRIIDNDTIVNIINKIYVTGNANTLSASEKALIDLALSSAYGIEQINANHVNEINAIVAYVDNTVTAVLDTNDQTFLLNAEAARLFMGDFRNQFSTAQNDNLANYLNGAAVQLNSSQPVIRKVGQLDLADILSFYLGTPHAQGISGLNDSLRRFKNIFVNNPTLNLLQSDPAARDEEAKGIILVFQDYIKERETEFSTLPTTITHYFSEFVDVIITPAKTALIQEYGLGRTIDGDVLVGEDRETVGRSSAIKSDQDANLTGTSLSDLILGESGNDTINAGDGDDVIYGGTGDDILKGGTGNDYYIHNTGDGFDTISDSDGTGTILFNGITLTGGYKINETTFRSNDQRFVYRQNADGSLSITDTRNPTSGITVENFSDGNLGLSFSPYAGGVQQVAPSFKAESGSAGQPKSGTDHNLIELIGTDADNNGPVTESTHALLASPVTTFINGLGGDDVIDGKSLSGITIWGGTGADVIDGGSFWTGEYYLEGDAGFREKYAASASLPILESGMGAIIYGDDPNTPATAHTGNNDFITASLRDAFIDTGPGVNTAEGARGDDIILGGDLSDYLEGNEGNDYLDGGNGANLLFGGADSDKIISGIGDDIIYGDASAGYFFNQDEGYWYLEIGTIMVAGTYYSITDASVSDSGNDYISSGGGSDAIYAGAGDDLVDAGASNDHIEGEGGNDTLYAIGGNRIYTNWANKIRQAA